MLTVPLEIGIRIDTASFPKTIAIFITKAVVHSGCFLVIVLLLLRGVLALVLRRVLVLLGMFMFVLVVVLGTARLLKCWWRIGCLWSSFGVGR